MHHLLRAAGLSKLCRLGAIAHGCSCKRRPPASPPHRTLTLPPQIRPEFPCSSPLQTFGRPRRARACSRSCLSILAPPRCFAAAHNLLLRRGARPSLSSLHAPPPLGCLLVLAHSYFRPQFCAWAPCVVAGACLCATPQCGVRSAWLRGRATTLPCPMPPITGADGSACCSRGPA
jgi:hypothetical protein